MAAIRRGTIKRYIRLRAIRRGLLGGSKFWFAVFVGGYVGRWFQKVTKRGEMPVVFSERIAMGDGLDVRHVGGDVN